MIRTNYRPLLSREFGGELPISGRLGLHGDSTFSSVFFVLGVTCRSPNSTWLGNYLEIVYGVTQKGVDGSEAAVKREAAGGT